MHNSICLKSLFCPVPPVSSDICALQYANSMSDLCVCILMRIAASSVFGVL